MAQFVFEKLPQHWLFVPSKRQVRNLLAGLDANVRRVEFYGTGYGHSTDRLSLGYVESRVVDGSWCFYLHIWGVRESAARPAREGLAIAALAEIERYVRKCMSEPAADTIKPAQLYLSFRFESGDVQPACSVLAVGKRSFPTGSWWVAKPNAAPGDSPERGDTDDCLTR
jgi:hypothetical protein